MNNLNIKLDILKCLNFDQLNNFQQINRQFSELIYKNEKVLACKIFEEISITDYNIQTNIDVTGHWLKMTEILEKIPLNEKLEEKVN
uniref:F-box domain-containing protein n=1 Tax=Meloidogyne hapla TaxID=6305 RepID=A0A1I8BDR8_MELHA